MWPKRTPTYTRASEEEVFPNVKNESPGGKGSAGRLPLLPTGRVNGKGLWWASLLCLLCAPPGPLVEIHDQHQNPYAVILRYLQGLTLKQIKPFISLCAICMFL